MGMAANQVRTRYDVNTSYRIGSYHYQDTSGGPDLRKKCVTAGVNKVVDLVNSTNSYSRDSKCDTDLTLSFTRNQEMRFYYAIFNTNGSKAKIDYVSILLSTSSSAGSGTWTEIGKATLDGVDANSTKTGWITINLKDSYPSFNPLLLYYLTVRVGDTTFNLTWHYAWYNDNVLVGYIPWTSLDKSAKKVALPPIRFLGTYDSNPHVLTDNLHFNHDRDPLYIRSSNSRAACFKISN